MISSEPVIPKLPSPFQDGEEIPPDLVGATILNIGTTDVRSESGELVIEYMPKGQSEARRLTLLFSERGMWIESEESLSRPPVGVKR